MKKKKIHSENRRYQFTLFSTFDKISVRQDLAKAILRPVDEMAFAAGVMPRRKGPVKIVMEEETCLEQNSLWMAIPLRRT